MYLNIIYSYFLQFATNLQCFCFFVVFVVALNVPCCFFKPYAVLMQTQCEAKSKSTEQKTNIQNWNSIKIR